MRRSALLVFMFLLVNSFMCENTYAVGDYIASIAVLCNDPQKAKDYVKELCKYNFERGPIDPITTEFKDRFLEDEPTNSENKVILYDALGDEKYHTSFTVIDVNNKPWNFGSIIKSCVGAIIFYDISDPTLVPIIKSNTFYKKDLESLIKIDTPINSCIKSLQSWRCNFPCGWHNALDFVTHSIDRVPESERKNTHMQMNRYTCELESELYEVDNKWNRGHPDISDFDLRCKANHLGWIVGEARRCIIIEGKNVKLVELEPENLGIQNEENGKKNYILEQDEIEHVSCRLLWCF